jgi:hypothetical protein
MKTGRRLSDYDHPSIRTKVEELTVNKISRMDKIESPFYFVRDEIKFGFPKKWDEVKASETSVWKRILQHQSDTPPGTLQSC